LSFQVRRRLKLLESPKLPSPKPKTQPVRITHHHRTPAQKFEKCSPHTYKRCNTSRRNQDRVNSNFHWQCWGRSSAHSKGNFMSYRRRLNWRILMDDPFNLHTQTQMRTPSPIAQPILFPRGSRYYSSSLLVPCKTNNLLSD
jgi:hypothetical protein